METMTAEQYREALATRTPKRSKYRNVRTPDSKGVPHASKWEAERADQLYMLERTGQIRSLQQQVPFVLVGPTEVLVSGRPTKIRGVRYVADFVYQDGDSTVIEDTKGAMTDTFEIKFKIILSSLVAGSGFVFTLSRKDGTNLTYRRAE